MSQFCAVILAAGFSTRMGSFKPLLPFGENQTTLSFVLSSWQEAGISQIVVVSGHKHEELEAEAVRCGASIARNPHPEDGMFSSVRTGLSVALARYPKASFFGLQPVDIPLILPETIRTLMTRAKTSTDLFLAPVYQGVQGHPPFMHRQLVETILTRNWQGGLREALSQFPCHKIAVEDPSLDYDMDRPEEYQRCLALLQQRLKLYKK